MVAVAIDVVRGAMTTLGMEKCFTDLKVELVQIFNMFSDFKG